MRPWWSLAARRAVVCRYQRYVSLVSVPFAPVARFQSRTATADLISEKSINASRKLDIGDNSIRRSSPQEIVEKTSSSESARLDGTSTMILSQKEQRRLLDSIGEKIGVRGLDMSPWYSVTYAQLIRLGAWDILKIYRSSIPSMLKAVYFDFSWERDRFVSSSSSSDSIHRDPETISAFLEYIEATLGFRKPEDWYKVSFSELAKVGVKSFWPKAGGLYYVLKEHRPSHDWIPWKFSKLPRGITNDAEVIKSALEYAEKSLGITRPEEWYTISPLQFRKLGVYSFISANGGLFNLLQKHRSEHKWIPWRFSKLPIGVTHDPEMISSALDHVESSLNIKDPGDWYRVSPKQFTKLGVFHFLSENGGIYKLLRSHRPSVTWLPWKFKYLPQGVVKDPEALGMVISYAENVLKISNPEEWYKVTHLQLKKLGILYFFLKNDGIFNVLKEHRSSIKWIPWRFNKLPKGIAFSPEWIKDALTYLEEAIGITKPDDWYRVSVDQARKLGVFYIISSNGGLYNLLKQYRSNFAWDAAKFVGTHLFAKKL